MRGITESLLFRALVLATLLITASLFATKQSATGVPASEDRPRAEQQAYNVEPEKTVFGVSAESWTAIFTGALFVATVALFIVTFGLFNAALQSSKDAERLFTKGRRPWIKASLKSHGQITAIGNGCYEAQMSIECRNIGKSPAFNVTSSVIGIHVGYEEFEIYFNSMRRNAQDRMGKRDITLFPDEDDSYDIGVIIHRDHIQESSSARIKGGDGFCYIAVCYAYGSSLSDEIYETSRLYDFGINSIRWPLPTSEEEIVSGKAIIAPFAKAVT